jgi:hypothetical protein
LFFKKQNFSFYLVLKIWIILRSHKKETIFFIIILKFRIAEILNIKDLAFSGICDPLSGCPVVEVTCCHRQNNEPARTTDLPELGIKTCQNN